MSDGTDGIGQKNLEQALLHSSLPAVWQSYGQLAGYNGEIRCLFQYNGSLYFSVSGEGTFRVGADSAISKVSSTPILWWHIVWNGYVYWASGRNIYRFDGTTHTLVYTHPNINAVLQSFAVYDFESRLYATGSSGFAAYTSDGLTWTEDVGLPAVAVVGRFYGLGALGNNLYAMCTVYGNDIIRKAAGGAWAFQQTYTGYYRRSPLWETPFARQNFPLTDLVGERLWCGSHDGSAFIWDGTALLKVFESYRPRHFITDDGIPIVLVKPIVVEGWMFLAVGVGSNTQSASELWLWDGLQFSRILSLPFRITSLELFLGRLWVVGNTVCTPTWLASNTLRYTQIRYTSNWGYVVSLPVDILNRKELPPARRRVWVDQAIGIGATLLSDADGGCLIPCTGYQRKTIWVQDSQAGTLRVQADMDGSGTYVDYPIAGVLDHALAAGTGLRLFSDEGMCFMRLRVVQGGAAGTLNARVLLE